MQLRETTQKQRVRRNEWADYFGLHAEILIRMESYCLIRWKGREFVVESVDLKSCSLHQAA